MTGFPKDFFGVVQLLLTNTKVDGMKVAVV